MIDVPSSKTLKGAHIVRSASWNKLREAALRLPDGYSGAMIYHDGSAWVVLAAPSGGVNVLSHDGTAPKWLATEACS